MQRCVCRCSAVAGSKRTPPESALTAGPTPTDIIPNRELIHRLAVVDCGRSAGPAIIEYVFEDCGDAQLLDLMGKAQQEERAAFACQLLAVGTFTVRRIEQQTDEHNFWCVDGWEVIAAEIGAELGVSRGRASSQMRYGQVLIERFRNWVRCLRPALSIFKWSPQRSIAPT